MSTLQEITTGYERGIALADRIVSDGFVKVEQHVFDYDKPIINAIAFGDNLAYMKWLISNGYAGKIKCVYIDPPFFTKAKYNAVIEIKDDKGAKNRIKHLAYDDRFERDLEYYIENITARLALIKELMADDGLLWVHLDWHSAHYVRIVLDEMFGQKRFLNEIVWKYKSGGSAKKHFSRKHDTLLLYSKTDGYSIKIPEEKSYNRELKAYNFKGVKEYKDEYGWYTMVNMKDVWAIDMVGRTSGERTGYATQKPIELMKRIIAASTDEGDICADFFCGSGSFLQAADSLDRRWLGCDSEELAVSIAKKRLDAVQANYFHLAPAGESRYHEGLRMKMKSCEELENGKKLYVYSVGEFNPDVDYGHIPLKDRGEVERLFRENPLYFIDYIMIDPDHHEIFSAEMNLDRDFDNIRFLSRGDAAFVAVDIFGKEYYFNVY